MATITLKNVPDDLHARLKMQAKAHKRSLNQEALFCIEMATSSEPRALDRFLAEAKELRTRIAASGVPPLTRDFAREAINEGRE